MLILGDRGVKAIWGAKGAYKSDVVDKGVLPRQIEVLANAGSQKYLAVLVETPKSILHIREGMGIMYLTSSKITEIEKGTYSLHHVTRYMAFNCG
jgi:hypothetical protein